MRSRAGVGNGPSGRRRGARVAGALGLAVAVALLHALLLSDPQATGEHRVPARSSVASIQLRPAVVATSAGAGLASPAAKPVPAAPATAAPTSVREPPPAPAIAVLPPDPAAALPAAPPDGAPMSDEPLPTYATRFAAPAQLRYEVRRGRAVGTAQLAWQFEGGRYTLQLQALLPDGARLEQLSQGGFDASGLAPERLADRRRGRGAQAANFRRQQGRISFSGPRWEYPLVPGVQDRLSWLVQLPAIAAAGTLDEQSEVALQVVGARGATSRWRFQVGPLETIAGPSGQVVAVRLVRQPEHLYDLRLEIWLDPARDFWPVRLRQTQVPAGETIEWSLIEVSPPPAGT